ncbi:hypothetical protein GF342_00930 [Candidatus Woesearchaeota archaeon]|nr:hypothetical protein [Candidatus Woesearchaeota archaeon]
MDKNEYLRIEQRELARRTLLGRDVKSRFAIEQQKAEAIGLGEEIAQLYGMFGEGSARLDVIGRALQVVTRGLVGIARLHEGKSLLEQMIPATKDALDRRERLAGRTLDTKADEFFASFSYWLHCDKMWLEESTEPVEERPTRAMRRSQRPGYQGPRYPPSWEEDEATGIFADTEGPLLQLDVTRLRDATGFSTSKIRQYLSENQSSFGLNGRRQGAPYIFKTRAYGAPLIDFFVYMGFPQTQDGSYDQECASARDKATELLHVAQDRGWVVTPDED